ncbi:hypothetical protein [Enorma massiliensis]|uniref:hypothetical protein n=1 Tax=Enorma massiliensis TaxID=1472761 RepID=UPI002E7946BC|nr:hypothetical protein [Enorma massiliensis]
MFMTMAARRFKGALAFACAALLALTCVAGCTGKGLGSGSGAVPSTGVVRFGIDAQGWTDGSSPFIAHITGETIEGEAVDFYHAVWPDGSTDTVELAAGAYEVTWTSAINADGSIYRVPGDPVQVVIDGGSSDSGDQEVGADSSFEQVPAGDVTQGDLDQILGDIEQAVGNGDDTLSGDAGQGVIDSATGNASNSPNADQDKIDQAGEEASGNVSEKPQVPSGTGGHGSGDGGSGSGSTGGGSGSSGSESGGGNSSASHTHSWVAQTKTVHHDAEYRTVHHEAEYQTVHHDAVTEERHICNGCGSDITGNESAHLKENILNGCGGWHSELKTVQAAWDEQVLVRDAWDEQVLVRAAWDETVTTGYKCSTCGATK